MILTISHLWHPDMISEDFLHSSFHGPPETIDNGGIWTLPGSLLNVGIVVNESTFDKDASMFRINFLLDDRSSAKTDFVWDYYPSSWHIALFRGASRLYMIPRIINL